MFLHTLRSYYSQEVHTKAVQKEALFQLYLYRYILQLSSIRLLAVCLSEFSYCKDLVQKLYSPLPYLFNLCVIFLK